MQASAPTTAQKIREIKVASAAPATPIWKPQIIIAFPTIFITFDTIEMSIGSLVFSCALKIDAAASYAAINGNDNAV